MPRVSVIIATYNWSEALTCALRSVRLQTFSDFEVLVVGDCCTDDSAEAVARFGDSRFRWINRERNAGGSWAPNNDGIAQSSGAIIAYLGHDDLWYPTHLRSSIDALDRMNADLSGAIAIMHGPPDSGVRSVTGIFPEGEYTPDLHIIPSSIAHRRAAIDRVGGWRDPASLSIPFDCEFLQRLTRAGLKIVQTGEVSVFKFSASQRRNAYKTRSVVEQQEMLARIERGEDIRTVELREVVRSVLAGRFLDIRTPKPDPAAGNFFEKIRKFKGASATHAPIGAPLTSARRFFVSDEYAFLEWHGLELHQAHGPIRWSGPGRRATFVVPVGAPVDTTVHANIVGALDERFAESLELWLGGELVTFDVARERTGTWRITARVPEAARSRVKGELEITFLVPRTGRREGVSDARIVGIALNYVELVPPL